ncbi:MAG: hypothetical protein ACQEXG_01785 [Pseudomonadota bacterium]
MDITKLIEQGSYRKMHIEKMKMPNITNKHLLLLASMLPILKQLDRINEDVKKAFISCHPPIGFIDKENDFVVLGNYRSLEIAKTLSDKKIPALVIKKKNLQEQIETLLIMELMNLCFFSLELNMSKYRALDFYEALDSEDGNILSEISEDFKTKQGFCRTLGINRRIKS